MKRFISIWLFMILSFGLSAQDGIQLDTIVNHKFQGIPLKQALDEISQQYGLRFSYSDSKINLDHLIQEEYTSVSLGVMLKDMLHKNDISYSKIENQLVLFPFNSNQIITIRGKVTDSKDGLPIPFANISLSGTYRGTSSNEEGEFEFSLTKLPSELLISHLTFEKKSIYVYDETRELEIFLTPAETTLDEITVTAKRNKNADYKLVKKAYDQLSSSTAIMKYGKAFYRQKSKRNERFTEIFELFYDIKYTSNGIADWAVQEGRYAFQNNHEYDVFLYNKNFTLLSRMFSIKQPSTESYLIPINADVKKLFDLDLKEVIKFDERFIAIISYTPKPNVKLPAAKGELYIDVDSYQILKLKGTFTDTSLDIIGFSDKSSAWENYKLDFQISFINDHSDQLVMDYIQVNHNFDYFFNKEPIGRINTSSLLTFYEHYSPVKSKKLGGAIDFSSSDMEVIDGIGYNATYWSQHPIVKRTPLEEKLIHDFEQNEAFGVVFMNNKDELVLLPDKKNSAKARQIINRYESTYSNKQSQSLFLRLDKDKYLLGDFLKFSAHILDRWSLKPFMLGSVLTVELIDDNNKLILDKNFDIHNGTAYGELKLSDVFLPGVYQLNAYTNANNGEVFKKEITISHNIINSPTANVGLNDDISSNLNVNFYPESGALLAGVKTKIVFTAKTPAGEPLAANWILSDQMGTSLQSITSNHLGLGSFEITSSKDKQYFLKSDYPGLDHKWMLPKATNSGFSIKIKDDKQKSIDVDLYQIPGLPSEIYLLSVSKGKVFSFYEKELHSSRNSVSLPIQHLPGGVNTLVIIDQKGKILAKRTFFIQPRQLDIQLKSATWKSKRSNKVLLQFDIRDQDGQAKSANLSAVCSPTDHFACSLCDIRNYLFFDEYADMEGINLNTVNDSTLALIDNLLITSDMGKKDDQHSALTEKNKIDVPASNGVHSQAEEPIIAELTISAGFNPGKISGKKNNSRHRNEKDVNNQVYWIPVLEIDERGIATIAYESDHKNQQFYVNIQGLSHDGLVGYQNFRIDPQMIKIKKNNRKPD